MINLKALISITFITYAGFSHSDETDFYENLIYDNVIQTHYSALIKNASADPVIDIRTDSGKTGYITYRFIAEVQHIFKGASNNQIEYRVTYEAGIKPIINNKIQIISLCRSDDNTFYVPGNGYRIDATEKLINIAKQATNKNSSLKNICEGI
ncbi:MAG: hypothetical protein DIZ80_16130 [endosymbiont of Galathealinum brachiosum]|uniref:Uncharacterized protein n=1 Tax=endosymbiont of Galathealinum brachiosum TaxID=2200906 RepID=A0A370D9N9_9GAMM|nr:MAG: hypothetical protein DIZ80_16130 [endosymbiont of Galathealinum brachiosum]